MAIVVVFVVATWAIAATSPAYTKVDVPPGAATLRLDADHPVALQRFRIALSPEATATSGTPSFQLGVNPPRVLATDAETTPPGRLTAPPATRAAASAAVGARASAARFFVMAATPDAASPDPAPAGVAAAPWQAEVTPGQAVNLPFTCGTGPCERAFWLIAQLDGDAGEATLDVDWQVTGSIGYGSDWPSGATGTISADPPVPFPGPVPAIAASTDPETIRMGPGSPALARVVEATIGAEALAGAGTSVAAMSVDLAYESGSPATDAGLVQVFPLDEAPGANPAASPIPAGADPFAGCPTGEACTRRFLVTIAWAAGQPEDVDLVWSATIRRTDLVRLWTTPAALGARVTRRIDLADTKPVTHHLEGDVTPLTTDRDPQVHVRMTSRTTSDDPVAPLLPVPASLIYRATVGGPVASRPPGQASTAMTIRINDAGTDERFASFEDVSVQLQSGFATRNGNCRLGDACPEVDIRIYPPAGGDRSSPAPDRSYHWSVDVSVRSYVDVPVEVDVDQAP